MNVTCTGCPAKYAVPDEKVRGKKVRITCKHCGTHIVVDGTTDEALAKAAAQPAPAGAAVRAPDTGHPSGRGAAEVKPAAQAKAPPAAAEAMFIVGFADDRQETHTVSQIVELYGAGKIDDEVLVWKDGMADWLSPFDVPELAAALRSKNVAPRAAAPAAAPVFAPVAEDEATLVVRSPLDDPEVAAAIAAAKASLADPVAAAPSPAAAPTKPAEEPAPATSAEDEPMFAKPAAARRVEKRAGAVDLFGNVAEAGSEGDVSLDLGSGDERGQKLTGARNESSVLFSLDALTRSEPKTTQAKAKERDRAASEALFGDSAPDSLMNLGSGALGAMAAPDFTKPVSAVAPVRLEDALDAPSAPSNKGRGGIVLLVGFLGIAAAAAVAFVMMKKQPLPDTVGTAPSATTGAQTAAEPSASEAPAANSAPATSATPEASASGAASAVASASAAASSQAVATPSAAAASAKAATSAGPTPAAAGATPAALADKPAAKPPEPPAAAKPPEPPATAEGAAFDKNAAVAALSAAAASAASCKTADGPTGSGKVSVTFAPSGRATATSVAGELAGTEVGGCVARLFRAAKVPPFSGDPVTVSKSFSVQ